MKHQTRLLRHRARLQKNRRASTLLIVMVLMGMLSLLGVIFYVFAMQERSNAEYYSDAAKEKDEPSLDADTLFDWALEQIIVGTDPRLKNSMLWGSRYSLLSNAMGVGYHRPGDLHPFNGEGINLIYDANTGAMGVDQNRNGLIDDPTVNPGETDLRYLLNFVDSPAAQGLTERQLVNGTQYFPQPDVGYTYPDINNIFLCYVGKVRDQNGGVHQVVKPSYLMPGMLRTAGGAPNTNWYNDPTTGAKVMRAHPQHLYVFPNSSSGSTVNRYLTDPEALAKIGPGAYGFPFTPMASTYDTTGGGAGVQLTQGRMGPYTKASITPTAASPNGDDPIEFDYDNDGDGIPESILMDLDFPPQEDSSGKMFVPLFLVTIHDLDALINLNVHGNLAKIEYGPADVGSANVPVSNSATTPFGTGAFGFNFISQSNLGLGPAEINPVWALNARYGIDGGGSVFNQHQKFFGSLPTYGAQSTFSGAAAFPAWAETGQMEFLWSKIGRPQYSAGGTMQDLYPGVYGEENRLFQAVQAGVSAVGGQMLPRPGLSMQDDQGNLYEGMGVAPFYQQPLDTTGQGTFVSATNPKAINWYASGSNRWISYNAYGNNSATAASSNIVWGTNPNLMTNSLTQANWDDPYEVAFYPTDKREVDNLFDPDEMLYLQLNNSEINRLNVTSRLAKLLPFNFAKTASDNARGESIRRNFTTLSNDRKNYALPYCRTRTWEYNLDTAAFDPNSQGPYVRNLNTNSLRFPPQFGGVRRFSSIVAGATAPYTEDPFRPFTRALLEADIDPNLSQHAIQRKLSINHLFTYDPASGKYFFRQLVPHPDDPGTTPISTLYPPPMPSVPFPPNDAPSQEYWARRDRQQMARDIYVLLYLMGHGDDSQITSTTSNSAPSATTDGSTLYSDVQLREMAQFAVNLVDAMDRDSVITRFEYDKDLSDGWNLDDDPYGAPESSAYGSGTSNYNSSYPKDGASRGEVFGVERLDLSLSEVSLFRTLAMTTPGTHNSTLFDDNTEHVFSYVEMKNHSPFDITFSDREEWQVVIRQDASGMNPAWERRLSLKSGANMVPSGRTYTIGTADNDVGGATDATTGQTKSIFVVDPNGGIATGTNTDNWMAPYKQPIVKVGGSAATSIYGLDLLSVTVPTASFRVEDENGNDLTNTTGAFLNAFSGAMPTIGNVSGNVKFVLRRRAHPGRTRLSYANSNDNPWVDVDTMTMLGPVQSFQLASSSDTAATIQGKLDKLVSYERPQPFAQDQAAPHAQSIPANTLSGLTGTNSNAVSPTTIWQPHFDRDFASVMDLLILPVFGPQQLTSKLRGAMTDTPEGQIIDQLGTGFTGAKSAAAKFLVPEDPSNWAGIAGGRYLDNRWHRILEMLEVPTRTNQNLGVGSDLSITRVPGKMNPNTFRRPESLAALLDDVNFLTLNLNGTDFSGNPYHPVDPEAGEMYDAYEQVNRDWWDQFIKSRDKIDPYWQANLGLNVPLPGLPGSKPFRSLSDVSYENSTGTKHASVQDTILRSLPTDGTGPLVAGTSRRRLLEVGNASEHVGPAGGGTTMLDPLIRNRLLAKFANNTTTRSNSFAIFISVKYFSAVADPANNGAIRIGGPYNGKQAPEHRGFFVVDRSKLEQGQYSGMPNYDFRTFVEYRKTLQTQ